MREISTSNWMSHISDETFISSISIAGTHNSAACFKLSAPSVQCQGKSITDQLNHGVRYLDIKLSKDYMSRGENVNDLMIVHGKFPVKLSGSYKFKKVLDEVYNFLKLNSTETVLISIKFENTMLNWNAQTDEFAKILFQKFIAHNRNRWYLSDNIPTLKYARGKAVLLRRFPVIENGIYKKFGIPALWGDDIKVFNNDSICIQDYNSIKNSSDLNKKVELFKDVIDKATDYHSMSRINSSSNSKSISKSTSKSSSISNSPSNSRRSSNSTTNSTNNTTQTDNSKNSPFSPSNSIISSPNSSRKSSITGNTDDNNTDTNTDFNAIKLKDPKLFINFCSGANYLHKSYWPSNVDKALRKFNIENHFTKNCGIIVFDFADRDDWNLVNKLIKTNFQ